MSDNDKRLEEIRERFNKATPGPWGGEHVGCRSTGGNLDMHGLGRQVSIWDRDSMGPVVIDDICVCYDGTHRNDENNAQFIAHSWDDIRWLVGEVERLRGLEEG